MTNTLHTSQTAHWESVSQSKLRRSRHNHFQFPPISAHGICTDSLFLEDSAPQREILGKIYSTTNRFFQKKTEKKESVK